jgi:hypothetical protein
MGLLKLAGFTGMWPQRDPRALPDNAATVASNVKVDGGQYLDGENEANTVVLCADATKSVYRIPLAGANTLSNSYWMQFADADTDVVRAPIVNDSFERFYWASPSTGLTFAPRANIVAAGTTYESGVEAPTTAVTAVVIGGTGEIVDGENVAPEETRVYTVTFINIYGEESQPGPTTEVVGHADQDYLITSIPQPPAPSGEAPYNLIRVYRTVSGVTGNTGFYKVADHAVGTTNFTDTYSHTVVTGNTQLESTGWAIAPDIDGLIAMPNGIFVGWKGNDVYFSENYRPHAWPAEYKITVEFPIVGVGVYGNNLVVCTTGNPAVISGVKSNSMSMTKIGQPMPCLSRGGIVSTPRGVFWPSTDGLAYTGPAGASIVTKGLIDREMWETNFFPSFQRNIVVEDTLYSTNSAVAATYGFSVSLVDPTEKGVSYLVWPVHMKYIGVEPWTGRPWGLSGVTSANYIYELFQKNADPLSYTWVSKEFVYPKPVNFNVFQCFYDDSSGDSLHLRVWVTLRGNDGSTNIDTLVYDQALTNASGRELRLPSGFKSDVWKIGFVGTATLQSFAMASSVAELRGV